MAHPGLQADGSHRRPLISRTAPESRTRPSGRRPLTGAEVSGLNLLTLADFKGVRVTDERVFRLLVAMGVDVRTRQR